MMIIMCFGCIKNEFLFCTISILSKLIIKLKLNMYRCHAQRWVGG